MRPFEPCYLLIFFICLPLTGSFAQSDGPMKQYLKKFRTVYAKAVLTEKPELLARYYADSIRLMPEFQKTVLGKRNALSYHRAFSNRFDILAYSREEIEILNLGTRAVEIGKFTMTVSLESTGQEHHLVGKYLDVWKVSPDHELSLLTEAWNYNHPSEIEAQLRFDDVPQVDVALRAHLLIDSPIRLELAALGKFMETTIVQHDGALWSQFYSDDGMFLYSRHPPYKGRASLDTFFREHAEEMAIFEKLDIRNNRIDELGDYVIVYASHIAIIRNGGFSGVFAGKDLAIWRREPNGPLKIFRHIAMYD